MATASPWKRPDELMQLHCLKKKKKALQKRMCQTSAAGEHKIASPSNTTYLDFSKLLGGDTAKRKNPFSKQKAQEDKRLKSEEYLQPYESSDQTLFKLLNISSKEQVPVKEQTDKLTTFSNLLNKYTQEQYNEPESEIKHKHLPIDWALKTKVRLMSPKPFAWDLKLKASEEASGITGFVRCLAADSCNSLDTSHHARFHQHCLYWQHPHLPWLTLFPRSTGRAAAAATLASDELVAAALHAEWSESFRSLFQLVRARQCPYFYLCANTFTILFRAAGLCGASETCALIAPTTSGFRRTLRQEDVEFTMPLRPENPKLNRSGGGGWPSSHDSCYDTMDEEGQAGQHYRQADKNVRCQDEDEEDFESDQFLSTLGFEADQIKKINHSQARVQQAAESAVDSAAESLVLVRGVDAQALFNFLLNCRSIVSPTGSLGGVPPTLLAPTAFQGATLQAFKVRNSTIMCEDKKYYSLELLGPVLPTTLHALLTHLRATTAHFSATFANLNTTEAFSACAASMAADEVSKDKDACAVPNAFNCENLSDCGLSSATLHHFCSPDPARVRTLDSVKYDIQDDAFVF